MTHVPFEGKACSPVSIHGPKEQIVFLGASVQSVSTSLGWNEQQSTLTVTLVEDNCTGPKVYYPLPGQRFTTNAADPGFIKPTIGTAVYFRMGGSTGSSSDIFEFAGIVQAWTVDASASANPVYTVTIVDPRIILSNLEVIVSDYAGEVGDVYNLINAYGWLESQGTSCPWTAVNGSYFGSPANGFGGAVNNNEGTPYVLLRNSIQRLLSGSPDAKYSPYGYACYRAPNGVSDVASDGRAYGMVFSPQDTNDSALVASGGYGPVANYYVDLSEIPFAPTFYRIPGPSISVLDLVSQICAETGCDYYIELIITSTGQKCIKVRVAQRATQPSLGEIESFVTATDNVIAKNVGRELRNEPSQGFVYGGYVQTVYQQSAASSRIIQFWGYDSAKNLTVADNTSLTGREEGDWKIYLDIRPLSASMSVPIVGDSIPGYGSYGAHYIEIHEKEIRMAIGGFDEWFNYAIAYNQGAGTEFGQWVRGNLNIKGPNIHFPDFTGMGLGADALSAALLNMIGYNLAFQPDQDPTDNRNEDLKKIHQFIVDWAETYYGKQFLVQLPYVCYRTDSDSGQVIYSDNPTNDGGWPAQGITDVLKLPCSTEGQPGEKLSFFADETNKVTPFCRFYEIGTGVGSGVIVQQDEYIAHNASDGRGLSVYLRGGVDEKPLEYGAYATAIFKLDSPVIESGLEKDLGGINPNFAGLIETAITSGVSGANLNVLKGGLQFNADGTRGSDGTLAIAIKRKTPDEVAVPMKSNTVRYGPKFLKGPPGQVHFVADDQLVPWEYDGYHNLMNAPISAMSEKIRDSVTYMQEGERGSINFPGTPTRRLGSELRSTQKTMNFMNMQATSFSAGGGSHSYNGIVSVPWNGSFGPNITNITVNYGENGFTTAYTLNTFTPSFGKFAKYNANRLSKMGKRAQEVRKIQRERNKLQKALAEANKRAASAREQMKQRSKQNATNGTNMTVGTVGEMAVSGIPATGQQAMGISRVSPRQLALGNSTAWIRQGGMSDDALFTPITQRQHPVYDPPVQTQPMYDSLDGPSDSCSGNANQATMAIPPLNGYDYKLSGLRYMGTKVSGDYLDPFAIVSTPKHNEENENGPNNHTHIVNVVHGQVPAGAAAMEAYKIEEGDFPNALRPMAHKGPLMLHGWGYDLNGKPIPNLNDVESYTKQGKFIKANEANFFLDHHLRKPETWPVGPIDLRFDKERGVWTTPIQYKIIQVENTGGDIHPGTKRDDLATIDIASTSHPHYDSGGVPYLDGHIELSNPSWGQTIPSGESLFAFWDSVDCTYYPMFSSGSGSDLCYLNSGTCMDTLAYGCLDESSKLTSQETIVFGSGIIGTNIKVKYDTPFSGHCGLTGHNYGGGHGISGSEVDAISIDVRLPIYNSSTGLVGGTEETCVDKWEQMKFSDCQFALYTGNHKGCDYVEISGKFPQIMDVSGTCQPGGGSLYDKPLNFGMLRFGSGLQLSGTAGCYGMSGDYTLNSYSNIKWESKQGTACVTNLPAIHGYATGINFRSGLIVTQDPEDACKIHVDARTTISGGYRGCASGSGYLDVTKTDLTTYEPFRNLVFGTGLVIDTLVENCTYQISSQPSIPWSSRQSTECVTSDPAIAGYFTGINFRSGLMVEVDSVNPCHINVDARTRIKGGMTGCKPGDDYQIDDWVWYRNLLVGSGLKLKQNQVDCEYEIQGVLPHLKGTNSCGFHTTPGGPFDSLNFGTGFEIIPSTRSEYCDYDINVGMYIKGGRTGCHDTSDEITTYKPYTKLNVGSGLKLASVDACTYSLDLAPGTRLFSGIAFGNIIPRTGLRFTPHDGQFCDFYLDALAISGGSTGCADQDDQIQTPVSVTQLQVTGNGLKLQNLGNGTVALSHAPHRALFSGFEFGNIIPRTGLSFVRHTEDEDCDWFLDVHSATRIKGGMTGCKPGTNYQINDWAPYTELLVGSGLKLKENVEDSQYEIQGILPHLKGANSCGYHTTPGGPFDSLNFGTGFEIIASPSEYCDYDINVGMYIKGGRTGCHDSTDEITTYKPYTKLNVGSGLKLASVDACTYSLDLAPGTRLFSGIAFGNIIPRNGLSFARTEGGQDCDWYLDSTAGALYAGHSGTCMSSNAAGCVDTINAIGTFNDLNLIMGKGITGVNTAMNDAQRTALGFQGGNALEIRTRLPIMLQPNDQHATGDTTTDCIIDWEQIKFPENQFTLFEGHTSGCDYVTVSGKFGSVQDLVVAGDACTPQFHWKNSEPCSGFDCLAFGTGLSVDDMGGGKFRIDASVAPRFANATACNTNAYNQIPNATSDRYQKITFGTGLKAGEYDSTKPCEITLNSTFSVKGGMTGCKPNGTNETISASVGGAVTETAQLLHFSDGLKVTRTATGCEYKITAPQPTINTNVFDNITLGTGLQLRQIYEGDGVQEYCDYTLDVSMLLKGGMTGCKPVGTNYTLANSVPFKEIVVGNGLKVAAGGGGTYTLSAPQPEIGGNIFDDIEIGTGLHLQSVDGYCGYRLNTDHQIKGGMSGCKPGGDAQIADFEVFEQIEIGNGLKLGMAGSKATITAPQPTIGGNIFDSLAIGSGLELVGNSEYCDYTINSKLKFKSCQGGQVGSDRTDEITLGAGLSGTASSNSVTIALNKVACSGAPTKVDVVRGIACVGSGFEVQMKRLYFTSEGLFIGSENI